MNDQQATSSANTRAEPAPQRDLYELLELDPGAVRISLLNPRFGYEIDDASVAPLAHEIKTMGQAHDAIAVRGADGVPELLAGCRRRAACRLIGRALRLRIYDALSPSAALRIAYREDRGALAVSLWDLSAGWQRSLADGVIKNEGRLCDLLGYDKSTISRGLALQRAPAALLDLFEDKRAISQAQWAKLAPLVEDQDVRNRLLERAALIAGRGLDAPAVTRQLVAAAAGKDEIAAVEVRNRHGKIIATIRPDHHGGITVRFRPMKEAHPTYRLEFVKLVFDRLAEFQKDWFGKQD